MMDEIPFGRQMKQRRRDRDLTQEALAEQVGCSVDTIRKLEAGGLRPSRQLAALLATHLAIPPDEQPAWIALARSGAEPGGHGSGGVEQAPAPASAHNFPTFLTPLIGRQSAVARCRELLLQPEVRLLTLTGTGGTGKTRLAVEVAEGLAATFRDGAYFVNLAPISAAGLVASEIAQTLGLQEMPGQSPAQLLRSDLAGKHLLLLLDNFEQVVEAAALLTALLGAAPRLKLLVTSREPLRLRGEKEFSVPPLDLPNGAAPIAELLENPAVRLFIERTRDASPDFALTGENAQTVAEIVRHLDGLPLAIELAAARVKVLPPAALLGRLQSRLALLTGGARDLPARQQTLRATIAWSYQLLQEPEQRLFRRLAVFAGGRALAAIETICNPGGDIGLDVLDALGSLIDKNLLRRETLGTGEPRFVMLETIHEFAREQLAASGETEEFSRRHAAYFLALAEAAAPRLRSAEREIWLAQLDAEQENLRAALTWSQAQPDGGETMLRLGAALFWFWFFRSYWTEGQDRIEAALAKSAAPIPARAICLWGAGLLALYEAAEQAARAHLDASIALAREIEDRESLGYALINLGRVLMVDPGQVSSAHARGEEGVAVLRELGDPWALAFGLQQLGITEAFNASGVLSYSSASRHIEESRRIFEEIGDRWGLAQSLSALAVVALWLHDFRTARQLIEEAIVLAREQDDKLGMLLALIPLGNIARSQANYVEAKRALESILLLSRELGLKGLIASQLHTLGFVALAEGDYRRARELCEESLRLARDRGDAGPTGWALRNLALLAHYEQDDPQAIALYRECLAIFEAVGQPFGTALSLLGLVQSMSPDLPPATAAQLLSAATARSQEVPDSHMDQFDRRILDQLIATTRARLGEAAFEREWDAGQALSLEQVTALLGGDGRLEAGLQADSISSKDLQAGRAEP
jgi:predicted ATPase/transcriptional regulator with XRE-family HTH domain